VGQAEGTEVGTPEGAKVSAGSVMTPSMIASSATAKILALSPCSLRLLLERKRLAGAAVTLKASSMTVTRIVSKVPLRALTRRTVILAAMSLTPSPLERSIQSSE